MKKNLYLFVLLCCSLFVVAKNYEVDESDNLLSAAKLMLPESDQPKYHGNSHVFNVYDSSLNGVKGAVFALIATPCTLGLYFPYAAYKLSDLMFKRSLLATSSAAHFNGISRADMERETALREITNRSAKVVVAGLVCGAGLAFTFCRR